MGLFFLIAGYFSTQSLTKKAPINFIKDKFVRLIIPLIFIVIFISPLISWIIINYYEKREITYFRLFLDTFTELNIYVGPLWFVEVLFIFSFFYAIISYFNKKHYHKDDIINIKNAIPTKKKLWMYILLSGLITFLIRILIPSGEWIFHYEFGHFVQYISAFIIGTYAYKKKWLNQITPQYAKNWKIITILLIISAPIIMVLGGALDNGIDSFMGGISWQSITYSIWEQILFISITISLIDIFKKIFNKNKKTTLFLSQNAYTVYIIHPLIIFVSVIVLIPIQIPTFLKFVIVSIIGPIICFILSHYIRKIQKIETNTNLNNKSK